MDGRFNIRVYGLWINNNHQVLITDECRSGMHMTKFPGGGLKLGEGLIDCLKREIMEEMNQEIEILGHFFTTDYYQTSHFNNKDQVISVYFLMEPIGKLNFVISKTEFDFDQNLEGQSFRWINLKEIHDQHFTFPIDQDVGDQLHDMFLANIASLN